MQTNMHTHTYAHIPINDVSTQTPTPIHLNETTHIRPKPGKEESFFPIVMAIGLWVTATEEAFCVYKKLTLGLVSLFVFILNQTNVLWLHHKVS